MTGTRWVRVGKYLVGVEPHRVTCDAMVGLGHRVRCWLPSHGVRRWLGNRGLGHSDVQDPVGSGGASRPRTRAQAALQDTLHLMGCAGEAVGGSVLRFVCRV